MVAKKKVLTGLMLASALAWMAAAPPAKADQRYEVTVERNVAVKMRDGAVLRADIYRPKAEGKFPVLLTRTPYDKAGGGAGVDFGYRGAARGYVVIEQDTRGRYKSEGEWYPFKHESEDGYDTVEWAGTLPYSDGRVGMFGGSYVGATQMLAAIANPPHLAGICPFVTASNYHDGWTYQGGAFEQWFNQSWTTGLAQDTLFREVAGASNAVKGQETLPLTAYPLYNTPKKGVVDAQVSKLAPYFLDWLAHPAYADYWKKWSIEERYEQIHVPALHIAAWYDIFLGGSLRNYMGLKSHAATEAARKGQRLLVTIGGHAGSGEKIGDVDFGPAAKEFDEETVILDWYDFLFKGVQNQFASKKRVKLFVMGANEWREEDDWPPAEAKETRFYLHSNGRANSAKGDGTLSTAAPATEASDSFVYDPEKPVPTVGGPLCCDGQHLKPGPRNQAEVEERQDVLVFSTPPMTKDTEVTGPVTLELFARSSAVDTDFTAKLVDLGPDGFARNLTEGIVRARYRDSQEKAEFLEPGKIYKFKIDLWATSNVFLKGHVIRLEVSGSNFPRFDRNLNTKESAATSAKFAKATNTILHDAEHPSALVLPMRE